MPIIPISDNEKPLIAALKTKNNSFEDFTDEQLVKFLRARDGDVEKAAEMLTVHLAWLKEWKPTTITVDEIKNALVNGGWRFVGKSKTGSPVILISAGEWKPENYSQQENEKYLAFWVNKIFQMVDSPLTQCILIFDQTESSIAHTQYIGYSSDLCDVGQNQYPEVLERAYFLNGGAVFETAWKLIAPLLNERTSAKIQFVSGDDIAPTLLKVIDESVLPTRYGGKAELPPKPNLPGVPNV